MLFQYQPLISFYWSSLSLSFSPSLSPFLIKQLTSHSLLFGLHITEHIRPGLRNLIIGTPHTKMRSIWSLPYQKLQPEFIGTFTLPPFVSRIHPHSRIDYNELYLCRSLSLSHISRIVWVRFLFGSIPISKTFKGDMKIPPVDTNLDYSANFARYLGFTNKNFDELMRLYLVLFPLSPSLSLSLSLSLFLSISSHNFSI
jgi:hypothetical protein